MGTTSIFLNAITKKSRDWGDFGQRFERSGLRKSIDPFARYYAREHYDVVHVQNFFPLISPAIYHAAKSEGVAVVQSVRNYRLFCLNGTFLRSGTCMRGLRKSVFSLAGSFTSMLSG